VMDCIPLIELYFSLKGRGVGMADAYFINRRLSTKTSGLG
jgi:hypothetical protein